MLYGICGKKRSGKDTVAGYMRDHGIAQIALAYSLKQRLYRQCRYSNIKPINDIYQRQMFDSDNFKESQLVISNRDAISLFSGALKSLENDGYPVKCQSLYSFMDSLDENTVIWTPRRLMQVFGTDIVCNYVGNHVWFTEMMKIVVRDLSDARHIMITDVRQPHEYKYLKLLGGTAIHVNRQTGYEDTHSTEAGLPIEVDDIVIDNNGTLEELRTKIDILINGKY